MSSIINWNNTIYYIKNLLGAEVNQIEIDEFKIQEIIETITLPEFCNYHNYTDKLFYPGDHLELHQEKDRVKMYIKDYPRQIIEIKRIYFENFNLDIIYPTVAVTPAVSVVDNYVYQMGQSTLAIRSWKFFRPDKIEFIIPFAFPDITTLIIEIGAVFQNPNEIEPTLYPAFRKLAAADVLDYIISLRTKYQQLATPQGVVNIDVSRLEQKAERLRSEAIQELEQGYIPDYFWDPIFI